MNIPETVKKNGKTIFGVVTGLVIAGASLMAARGGKEPDDCDDYDEDDYEPVDCTDEDDAPAAPADEVASEE